MYFKTDDNKLELLVKCLNNFYHLARNCPNLIQTNDYISAKKIIEAYYIRDCIDRETKSHLEGKVKFIWMNRTRAETLKNLKDEIIKKNGYVRSFNKAV